MKIEIDISKQTIVRIILLMIPLFIKYEIGYVINIFIFSISFIFFFVAYCSLDNCLDFFLNKIKNEEVYRRLKQNLNYAKRRILYYSIFSISAFFVHLNVFSIFYNFSLLVLLSSVFLILFSIANFIALKKLKEDLNLELNKKRNN